MTTMLNDNMSEIERRAQSTGLLVEHQSSVEGDDILALLFDETGRRMPRMFGISSNEQAEALLATPFEHVRLLPRYEALVDLRDGTVEAQISGRILRILDEPQKDRVHFGYQMAAFRGQAPVSITLDRISDLLAIIGRPRWRSGAMRSDDRTLPVLRFRGFDIQDVGSAQKLLESIGIGVLFELELTQNLGARFVPSRERSVRMPNGQVGGRRQLPQFPQNKYDPEPLQLYMYARDALGMPLLRFLAYYQAIEFFFPRYSEAALRRRVERLVKHPGFSAHNDRDIGALIAILQEARGRGFGSELEQLKETLKECVEATELRDFICASEEREQFFRDKRSPLTSVTFPLQDKAADLRDHAAARIYDLRCKIVHAKSSDQERVDLLLPNSPEAELIRYDVGLVRLAAERVITASASPLSL
jgi:hypothetical protein